VTPSRKRFPEFLFPQLLLLAFTLLVVVISGYHFGIEDQAIYAPAILRDLHPQLFPHDFYFFEAQTRATLLDKIIAGFVRFTHIPLLWTLLLFHLAAIYAILFACWRIIRKCFEDSWVVWSALMSLACLLTIPIAGTAQFIVDQYLHPRAIATALILIPVADLLPGAGRWTGRKQAAWCGIWLALAAVIHIQIAAFGACLYVFLTVPRRIVDLVKTKAVLALAIFPFVGSLLAPGSPAWQEAARTRSQHYLLRWEWYEIVGIIAPIALLYWFSKLFEKRGNTNAAWLAHRLTWLSLVALVGGAALIIPRSLERLTPYQPMRIYILTYIFLLLLCGALIGESLLKRVPWRWVALFVPLAAAMFTTQVASFPASPHIEWPGLVPKDSWEQAFLWVRSNTPSDAYFALNPRYLSEQGEDYHGFRAWAWRGQMADVVKDPGVVSLVPAIAPEWQREVHALSAWDTFTGKDFTRLHADFGVNWVILERTLPNNEPRQLAENLECPYQNRDLYVCRIR
jgi:hypothetical protein